MRVTLAMISFTLAWISITSMALAPSRIADPLQREPGVSTISASRTPQAGRHFGFRETSLNSKQRMKTGAPTASSLRDMRQRDGTRRATGATGTARTPSDPPDPGPGFSSASPGGVPATRFVASP
jgi:hypothetical protein